MVIQETEMKQRSARMVGLFKSFQFISLAFEQDVLAQESNLHKRPEGGSQ